MSELKANSGYENKTLNGITQEKEDSTFPGGPGSSQGAQ